MDVFNHQRLYEYLGLAKALEELGRIRDQRSGSPSYEVIADIPQKRWDRLVETIRDVAPLPFPLSYKPGTLPTFSDITVMYGLAVSALTACRSGLDLVKDGHLKVLRDTLDQTLDGRTVLPVPASPSRRECSPSDGGLKRAADDPGRIERRVPAKRPRPSAPSKDSRSTMFDHPIIVKKA